MSMVPKLTRSFAYVAPCMADFLAASRAWKADVLCLDLEDATPPGRKDEARGVIQDFLSGGRPRAAQVLVRVNGLDTPWGQDDLRFAGAAGVDGVVLPKVEGADMVRQARDVIGRLPIWCMIETPLAVLRAEEIAAEGVEGLVIGGTDLAEGLGVARTAERLPLLHALSHVVLVARAYGVPAIDAYHHDFGDLAGIEASTLQSAQLGFHGKAVFSPDTIAIANRLFRPSEQEIKAAEAALAGSGGQGSHIDHAKAVLELARRAAETDDRP